MKRLASSDSFGALMSMCPNSTDDEPNQENSTIYSGGMVLEGLDEDVEEFGRVSEKKRRLRVDQVKALEKNFEVENKLEPERKVKLAQDLGLQPRQVAVWFQNRRARWKTKQLERDYGVLKANHDALMAKFEALQKDNESLLNQIDELKSKMKEEGKIYIKEEVLVAESDEKRDLDESPDGIGADGGDNHNQDLILGDMKDGGVSSDSSYSSAVLNNEDNSSPMAVISSSGGGVLNHHHQLLDIHSGLIQSGITVVGDDKEKGGRGEECYYQPQLVKIEEHNFLGEECCSSLFCDDQAPTLHWYCSDEWN